jgi:multidrug efflux pump subunit AcrB
MRLRCATSGSPSGPVLAAAGRASGQLVEFLEDHHRVRPGGIDDAAVQPTPPVSVQDVERTLVITFALVVTVIFIFLRSPSATIIPSVTVPPALLGTAAVMYLVGYSIDNLSLMGPTIAVGFVVDDAIVMLENIQRHIEDGLAPMEAALKGAGEIGFTILSISISSSTRYPVGGASGHG